jgi:hypothetical protein
LRDQKAPRAEEPIQEPRYPRQARPTPRRRGRMVVMPGGARTYAKAAGDFEMQNWAAEIRIRAARRVGQLLEVMRASGELAKNSRPKKLSDCTTLLTLPDIGVSRDESAKWMKLAAAKNLDTVIAQIIEERSQRRTIPTHESSPPAGAVSPWNAACQGRRGPRRVAAVWRPHVGPQRDREARSPATASP